jgi:hypothetical protein
MAPCWKPCSEGRNCLPHDYTWNTIRGKLNVAIWGLALLSRIRDVHPRSKTMLIKSYVVRLSLSIQMLRYSKQIGHDLLYHFLFIIYQSTLRYLCLEKSHRQNFSDGAFRLITACFIICTRSSTERKRHFLWETFVCASGWERQAAKRLLSGDAIRSNNLDDNFSTLMRVSKLSHDITRLLSMLSFRRIWLRLRYWVFYNYQNILYGRKS